MAREWRVGERDLLMTRGGGPLVMGVLNVTPDSFSDGGEHLDPGRAIARAREIAEQGADILDVGGESTRPGAEPVSADEEARRVLPVVRALVNDRYPLPISIDTLKPEVARRAVDAGASIVNDVRGFRDPDMAAVLLDTGASGVVMHMAGTPRDMQIEPRYDDVVGEVREFLAERLADLEERGVDLRKLCVDPGVGFGKTFEHNLALLRNLDAFRSLGAAVLVGTSRKSMLGRITGRPPDQRVVASAVSAVAAAVAGADVVRVHDVAATRDAWLVWDAQIGWPEPDDW